MSKRVILLRTNRIDRDPWLEKEISTLIRGGFSVTLLCWDRNHEKDSTKRSDPEIRYKERVLRLRAPWGKLILPYLFVWWFYAFSRLMIERFDIVQAINFDSIVPAVFAAKLKRKPIIYEIFDVYADLIRVPELIRKTGIFLEKLLTRTVTAVIIANKAQIQELNGIPNRNITEIYNTPPDVYQGRDIPEPEIFTLFYAGVLYRSRPANLDKVILAIRDIDEVKLMIAGYGDQADAVEKWAEQSEGKVIFLGKIDYREVLERSLASSMLFALYNPVVPAVRYASCNKVFEAMMCGKPVLVSQGTAYSELVKEEECGLVVDSNNEHEIRKAILKIKNDNELYRQLGMNGRRAYEEKYSREIMENRLQELYWKTVLKKSSEANGS